MMGSLASSARARVALLYVIGVSALALIALAAWAYFFSFSLSRTAFAASCILAIVCVISRRFPVSLNIGKAEFEATHVAILTALLLGGPLCGLLVAIPSMLYRERLRTLFCAATYVLEILAAAYVLEMFSKPLLFGPQFDVSFIYGAVGAGLALCSLDATISPVLVQIKYGTPLPQLFREMILPPIPSDLAAIIAAAGTAYATIAFGPAAALVLFCGAAMALVSLHLVKRWRDRLRELNERIETLEREKEGVLSSPLTFATRLLESLGARDGYTARHAAASAVYAADIAENLRLDPATVEKVRISALLQNVGLASAPDEVLLKPKEKLNPLGRMRVEEHARQSERILSGIPGFEEAARWVRWHHERMDGTGYPDRLRGEWIPLEARILAVAEHYASLILDGPASPGLSPIEARRRMVSLAGAGLDHMVVRVLLMLLDTNDENYATASDNRFAFSSASPKQSTAPNKLTVLRAVDAAEAQ